MTCRTLKRSLDLFITTIDVLTTELNFEHTNAVTYNKYRSMDSCVRMCVCNSISDINVLKK